MWLGSNLYISNKRIDVEGCQSSELQFVDDRTNIQLISTCDGREKRMNKNTIVVTYQGRKIKSAPNPKQVTTEY